MSKAISELRQWVMGELWETDLEKKMGHQILRDLDYIEALEPLIQGAKGLEWRKAVNAEREFEKGISE